MSLSDEERRAIVLYRIEKTQTALADIHKILTLEMWSIIANRMYYALYYAASALLTGGRCYHLPWGSRLSTTRPKPAET